MYRLTNHKAPQQTPKVTDITEIKEHLSVFTFNLATMTSLPPEKKLYKEKSMK
jgi:hypothetical protein